MRVMTAAMLGGQDAPGIHSDADANQIDKTEIIEQVQMSPERPAMRACLDMLCCHRRRQNGRRRTTGLSSAYTNIQDQAKKKLKADNPSKVVDKIDTIAKFLFPSLYFIFNGLYWSAFLYWIPDEIDSIPSIRDNVVAPE